MIVKIRTLLWVIYNLYPNPYLRKWQKSFAFDVPPDLVYRGGELVHLPLDVVGHTLRKLGQVSFVLQNWRHHLKSRENCQICIRQQSRVSPLTTHLKVTYLLYPGAEVVQGVWMDVPAC